MKTVTAADYQLLLREWLRKLPDFLRRGPDGSMWYGTGESAHWPTQSNLNVCGALAVLAQDPALDAAERTRLTEQSLALLRYAIATHLTGNARATDGKQWGCHWISVLGLERISHALTVLEPLMTSTDRDALRRLTLTEADWLLDEYPVVAAIDNLTGKNKPESNIWNGAFLLRAALDYPEASRAALFREKATEFLVNGLSFPEDEFDATLLHGKPVSAWFRGANFTSQGSLDHHGYLNVGYMVISLSNLAMLHFYCRTRGYTAPPELYRNAARLWRTVKLFTFPDGRLLRLGGDTRARYTYCQNYAIPMWLFAADALGDADAAGFEAGWLNLMRTDQLHAGDGGFYSGRLNQIAQSSYYYYARLESDAALCLSWGAWWQGDRTVADKPGVALKPDPEIASNPVELIWQEPFHGAFLLRSDAAVRSFVWHAAQGPTALCVPPQSSDLAEWQGNLRGEILSSSTPEAMQGESVEHGFPGGFLTCGTANWREINPLGEGEGVYEYAEHHTVCAALPDGRTMLFLEYARILKEVTLREVKGMSAKIPNDIFNRGVREYRTAAGDMFSLPGPAASGELLPVAGDRLCVDNALCLFNLYGGDGLSIRRASRRNIVIRKPHGPFLRSLYADEICNTCHIGHWRPLPGEVVLDDGYAAAVGGDLETPHWEALPTPGELRAVKFGNASGSWLLAANFGAEPVSLVIPASARLLGGTCVATESGAQVAPGTAALWVLE